MKIFIKNAFVITMDETKEKIIKANILIENDTIIKIDNNTYEADTVIDATNKYIIPGLINSHTHVAMSIFRESSEGYNLQDWLSKKIWPAEDKLTEDDVYYGMMMSFIEMIKSGTTTCCDFYYFTDAIIKALDKSKFRCVTTRTLMDSDGKRRFTFK
ncbi:MAG: amidohydrolase family protein [Clostridia bacterium]